MKIPLPDDLRKLFQRAGHLGGTRRAQRLTQARKSEIARLGAIARWGSRKKDGAA